MTDFESNLLRNGDQLHLHHGPIDLLISAETDPAKDRLIAYRAATMRFKGLLEEIVSELPLLKRPPANGRSPTGPVARRMWDAVHPHADGNFVTPMAAVAGSVADEILEAITHSANVRRAYVNNGGDIALALSNGQIFKTAIRMHGGSELARVAIKADQGVGGLATSGAGGRSFTLGIADSVTAFASSAAAADAAATLIANAVDLPGHPAIVRRSATELNPDSDLGKRMVVTRCGILADDEIQEALSHGENSALGMAESGLIVSAALYLRGTSRFVGMGEGQQAQRGKNA